MKILFLLLTLQWFLINTYSKIIVRDANIAAVSRNDIGMIFYLTLQNTASCGYEIYIQMLQCTELVDVSDRDCGFMYLLGGDMGHINGKCFKNVTLLYPNMYLHNRQGSCLLKIDYINKQNRQYHRKANISFDTTVSHKSIPTVLRGYYSKNEVAVCDTVDLDPLNNCEPIDCHMKYLGSRNFYNKKWKRCQKVPKCVSDLEKSLPDVVYTPISNKCMDMENLITKSDLRFLQEDDIRSTGNSAIRNYPIPLNIMNCHHGILNNETGMCSCYDGWTSPAVDKDQSEPTLFTYHMCNIEISNWYDINSNQIKTVALFIAIGAVLVAIFMILVAFVFHGLYTCIKRKRRPHHHHRNVFNSASSASQSTGGGGDGGSSSHHSHKTKTDTTSTTPGDGQHGGTTSLESVPTTGQTAP